MDHILSELFTMTCLSWVALQGMAHSFIELGKAVVHVISLVETEVKVKVKSSSHVRLCNPTDYTVHGIL